MRPRTPCCLPGRPCFQSRPAGRQDVLPARPCEQASCAVCRQGRTCWLPARATRQATWSSRTCCQAGHVDRQCSNPRFFLLLVKRGLFSFFPLERPRAPRLIHAARHTVLPARPAILPASTCGQAGRAACQPCRQPGRAACQAGHSCCLPVRQDLLPAWTCYQAGRVGKQGQAMRQQEGNMAAKSGQCGHRCFCICLYQNLFTCELYFTG